MTAWPFPARVMHPRLLRGDPSRGTRADQRQPAGPSAWPACVRLSAMRASHPHDRVTINLVRCCSTLARFGAWALHQSSVAVSESDRIGTRNRKKKKKKQTQLQKPAAKEFGQTAERQTASEQQVAEWMDEAPSSATWQRDAIAMSQQQSRTAQRQPLTGRVRAACAATAHGSTKRRGSIRTTVHSDCDGVAGPAEPSGVASLTPTHRPSLPLRSVTATASTTPTDSNTQTATRVSHTDVVSGGEPSPLGGQPSPLAAGPQGVGR